MTADEAITNAYAIAKKKATAPDQGSQKYLRLLQIIDRKQKEWAREPGIIWSSLYERQTVTSSSTDTFDLDDTVDYIVNDDDDPILVGTQPFKLVRPTQLYRYKDSYACAKIGQSLVLSRTLDSNFVGQDITVPVVLRVDDITQPSDEVQVDDPNWLCYASAAEYARNDETESVQYSNLYDIANNLMAKMKEADAGTYEEVEREAFFTTMDWS